MEKEHTQSAVTVAIQLAYLPYGSGVEMTTVACASSVVNFEE